MKLSILGSGTFVPESKRNCSGYLVEIGNEKIILDFGRGTIHNLLKLKIDLHDLDKIFISHMHADHSSELVSFIALILDTPEKKKLKKKYTIYGPKGIKQDINKLLQTFHLDKHKNLNRIQIKEINTIKRKTWEVKAHKVKHDKINSLAYSITKNNKKICYSGDSTDCKGLREACKEADIAIIESTAPKKWKMKDHMNGEDVGKLAQEMKVKNLVLVHVANTYLPKVKKDVRKEYKGKFSIAKDLMKFNI